MSIEITTATSEQLQGIRAALEIGDRNQPDGFAGLSEDGIIEAAVGHRVGTLSAINAITLLTNEIAVTSDDPRQLRLGDGATAGGLFLGSPGFLKRKYLYTITNNVQTTLFTFAVQAGQTYEYELNVKLEGLTGTGNFSVSFTHPTVGYDEYDPETEGFHTCGIGTKTLNGTITQVLVIEGDTLVGAGAGITLSATGYGIARGTITFGAAGNFIVRYNTVATITVIGAPIEFRFRRIK